MDMKDAIEKARRRDAEMQDIAEDILSMKESKFATVKAVQWALTTDRELVDIFDRFVVRNPGLVDITHFVNSAGAAEFNGDFCYARHGRGQPVISLTHPTLHDEETQGPRYVTPDPSISTFAEFVSAVEAWEAQNQPQKPSEDEIGDYDM